MDNNEIQSLIKKDTDSLLKIIGYELTENEGAHRAFPPSIRELIEVGRDYFNKHVKDFQSIICSNESLKSLIKESKIESVTLVSAIADLISSVVTGISPFTVATLLYKYGIDRFCNEKH